MGTILAMQGNQTKARRYFDESIRVAEFQEAPYELAKSRLYRARAGLQFNWSDSEEQLASAETEIDRITAFWHE